MVKIFPPSEPKIFDTIKLVEKYLVKMSSSLQVFHDKIWVRWVNVKILGSKYPSLKQLTHSIHSIFD